jgi:hypothetical protein
MTLLEFTILVHNKKMIPVKSFPGMGGGRDKGE